MASSLSRSKQNQAGLDLAAKNHRARVEKEGRDIVDSVCRKTGPGWDLVGARLQHALVCGEIVRRMLVDEDDGSLSTWTWITREAFKALADRDGD
jgi:hypothetical protein